MKINIVAHEIESVIVIESLPIILLTTMQEFCYCLRLAILRGIIYFTALR